jgi:deoxyxylulose-5-phosphate synthase
VRDAAAGYGGHIVAIPRDNLPVLTKEDGTTPLWNAGDSWEAVTAARVRSGAKVAILAIGAPSYLAVEASDTAAGRGAPADVYIVNGFPIEESFLEGLPGRYERILTLEDGVIGTVGAGLRGFAAYAAGKLAGCGVTLEHLGIVDPTIAPSETFLDVWAHYGMTAEAIAAAVGPVLAPEILEHGPFVLHDQPRVPA